MSIHNAYGIWYVLIVGYYLKVIYKCITYILQLDARFVLSIDTQWAETHYLVNCLSAR